ncbi:hypothetical protein BC941DRAFT_516840 [Chlamydoabsidia padenii]|nr:hypothetical protein BC941DRAFT_516840 [Chlamydoabsidia padenii]
MSVDNWTLQVKSLDHVTHSVTVSSAASVLQLKEAIQPVFDIASQRQRLIFQGKVLKDGKQLTEYANLQDGKIIHLVSRPADAPTNLANDDPQTNNAPRGTMPQLFPSMFGPSEGYTFITVDANITDLGENNSTLTSLLSSLFGDAAGLDNLRTERIGEQSAQNHQTENHHGRSLFGSMRRNTRQSSDSSLLFDGARHYFDSITSFETRLTRVLAAMENIQANLDTPPSDTDINQLTWSAMTSTNPEQTQTIRSRLRGNGRNETVQIGMAVSHLTDLMEAMVPRLRGLAQDLQAGTQSFIEVSATTHTHTHTHKRDVYQLFSVIKPTPELRRMVAIIRNTSMVHHAIGNIMAGSEDPSRRDMIGRNRTSTTTRQRRPTATRAIYNPSTLNNNNNNNTSSSSTGNKRQTRSSTAVAAATTTTTTTTTTTITTTSSSTKRRKTTDDTTTKKGKGKRRDDTTE